MANDAALLRLLQLVSPALPVGAYSYSEGLEYAVHAGWVGDGVTLKRWLEDALEHGAARLEAAVLVRVYEALRAGDAAAVRRWNAWLTAARETEELRAQSLDMGRSLLRLLRGLDPPVRPAVGEACNFVSAFAAAAVHWGIGKRETVIGYLQSWAGNLIGAGIKLIPLGQTAGQQLQWELQGAIERATGTVLAIADADLSAMNWGLALASMAHETQYTRLFRS